MKTLDELIEKVDGIAESQGKLLAALNDLQAEFSGDFAKLYNGHGLALSKIGELIDAWNLLTKQKKPLGKSRSKRRGG
jgi:hypothetical protein